MIPKNAPIQQTQFAVLESSVAVNVRKADKEVDLNAIPLDIDYDIYFKTDTDRHIFRIVMTIKGNTKKTVPGYIFMLKVGGEYLLSEDIEPESREYNAYLSNTGVACLINEARVYLQTLTAFSPFGAYIMPMVDMADLTTQQKDKYQESAK